MSTPAATERSGRHPGGRLVLNRTLLVKLIVVACMMFGFGYALVPLYRQICEVLGVNVLTKDGMAEAPVNTQVDMTRTVSVELDGNAQGPWRFRPTTRSIEVHPGELTTVTYEVVNTQGRAVKAQAIPSYAPQLVTPHFKKVECFCFQEQTLQANEARQMPVVFFIDPALPRDVKNITLSYTFFEIGGAVQTASSGSGKVK